jgi:LEA14-like dessication related protein
MQRLRILLILINIGIILGPLIGVAIIYRNNLESLIIPPEIKEMFSNTANPQSSDQNSSNNSGNFTGYNGDVEIPQYENSTYDPATKTLTVVFKFTNPVDFSITLNDVEADVRCHAHNFLLGHAHLSNAMQIPAKQTVDIKVLFVTTTEAEQHFQAQHSNQSTINADLVNIVANVSGMSIQIPDSYNVDIPLFP